MVTRITEGMTRWSCGDLDGAGLSEYLDQIVDDTPRRNQRRYLSGSRPRSSRCSARRSTSTGCSGSPAARRARRGRSRPTATSSSCAAIRPVAPASPASMRTRSRRDARVPPRRAARSRRARRRRRHAARHRRTRDGTRRRARRSPAGSCATTSSPPPGTVLVDDLGRFLAGLHAIDPAEVPGASKLDDPSRSIWSAVPPARRSQPHVREDPRRGWSRTARRAPPTTLVHGDLRLGNVIVGPRRARGRDRLGARARRRSARGPRLAVREGVAFRRAARGGRARHHRRARRAPTKRRAADAVDRDALHWWLVAKTLHWGIGCMGQADVHLTGRGPLGGAGGRSGGGSPSRSGT